MIALAKAPALAAILRELPQAGVVCVAANVNR